MAPIRLRKVGEIEDDLTKAFIEIRKMIQEFTVCSSFKEIDEQNAAVRVLMEKMRNLLEELERSGKESLDKSLKSKYLESLQNYREQLTACHRQFRLANVEQISELEKRSTSDLLNGSQIRQRQKVGGKEEMLSQHSNVTNNLKAISRQLAATVERSQLTVSNLEGSSKTIQEIDEEHRSMQGVLGQSRKLITKYMKRDITDKVLIMFALAFFFAVVLYILRKRVFPSYGPLEMIIYMFSLLSNLVASIANIAA